MIINFKRGLKGQMTSIGYVRRLAPENGGTYLDENDGCYKVYAKKGKEK